MYITRRCTCTCFTSAQGTEHVAKYLNKIELVWLFLNVIGSPFWPVICTTHTNTKPRANLYVPIGRYGVHGEASLNRAGTTYSMVWKKSFLMVKTLAWIRHKSNVCVVHKMTKVAMCDAC